MNFNIGPYIVKQRTPYSKLYIEDVRTGKLLEPKDIKDFEEIIKTYKEQSAHPEYTFAIDGTKIIGLTDTVPYDLEYLFIPEGITEIADLAFSNRNIKMVSLPETLRAIGTAFAECGNLEYINIPDNVSDIAPVAFDSCYNLKWAKLPRNLTIVNQNLFAYCKNLEEITIPDSVTIIENKAFSNCEKLRNVKLPKSLKTMNLRAFEDCPNLESIILPDGLEFIDEGVFSNCERLKEIIIPNSVKEIGERAFINCISLEYIELPDKLETLSFSLFAGCLSLRDLTLPDTICEIESRGFVSTKHITAINIPKNLDSICRTPFSDSNISTLIFNHSLEHLTIPSKEVDLISWSNIEKLVIGQDCKKITPKAFGGSAKQITKIDYLGAKEEFKEFKNNNKDLFEVLSNLREINVLNGKMKDEKEMEIEER